MTKVNKLTPHKDGKRRKMVMTKLTAVALTARGANQEAHVTFFKSHKGGESTVEKRTVLASMEALHTHAVQIDDYARINKGGSTSWAGGEGNQHSHDFVINDDGSVEIGANEGHLHYVDKNVEQIIKSGLSDEQLLALGLEVVLTEDESTANKGGKQSATEDNTMTDVEKAAQKAKDDLALLKTQLATAVLLGSMNDGQRAYHKNLDEAGQAEFLAKSVEDRDTIVKTADEAANVANPVVYKTHKGVEFFKNDDTRMVEMAKEGDLRDAKIAKQEGIIADSAIAKRATELFKNLSGEQATHNALLKAVDGIEDEAIRKNVMETLQKSDAGISDILKAHGTQDLTVSDNEAGDKLEALAKKYVSDNPTVNYYDAYDIVAKANAELLQKAVG